jgi:hypothetical protein
MRLDNFKGKIHTLSNEDRIKGGSMSSQKKTLANRVKNLKHGKCSELHHLLLTCVDCPFIFSCEKRNPGYCPYLLEDLNKDKIFRKQILERSINKNNQNPAQFISTKYYLKNWFIERIKNKIKK